MASRLFVLYPQSSNTIASFGRTGLTSGEGLGTGLAAILWMRVRRKIGLLEERSAIRKDTSSLDSFLIVLETESNLNPALSSDFLSLFSKSSNEKESETQYLNRAGFKLLSVS